METTQEVQRVSTKTDFTRTNIHCSSIGYIMGSDKKKTNMQKYQEAVEKEKDTKRKYEDLADHLKDMKTGFNMRKSIIALEEKTKELELIKDVEPLSNLAKWHLKNLYGYEKYHKWNASSDKGTKFTNKGNLVEQSSIELLSKIKNVPLVKNEIRVNNEFLTGIPDAFIGPSIYQAKYIVDVKSSWDIQSFLNNLGKPLYSLYWWQIQGYLAITGAEVGEVSYCLVNTPQSLINNEVYRLKDRMDVVTDEDPAFLLKEKELISNLTFDDMPESDRVLRFLVERDDNAIQKIYNKVASCRGYLKEVEEMHNEGVFLAREPSDEESNDENGDYPKE